MTGKRCCSMLLGSTIIGVSALTLAPAPAFAEDVVVRYLVPQWASTNDRREARQNAFTAVIESFEAANPGIRLEETVGTVDPVTIAQGVEQGEIDAVWINSNWYPGFQVAGLFANLDDYAADGAFDPFFDWTIDAMRSIDGNVGCLWHNTDTPLVFYDTTAVATPPETWSDVREIATEIRAGGRYGMSYPLMLWTQSNAGLFEGLGGQFVDDSGAPVLFEGNNRAILAEMFAFYQGLMNDDLIPAQNATARHGDHLPPVYAGDVVMFLSNSNAHIRSLEPNLPPGEYENWSAVPLPRPDAAEAPGYVAGGWYMCAVAQPDNPEVEAAAASWVLHATGLDAQTATNAAGGWLPPREDVYETDPMYSENPYLATAFEALSEHGWTKPQVPIYNVINSALNAAASSVMSGQATIDEALDAAEADVMAEFNAAN